jgi:hypothetical protein
MIERPRTGPRSRPPSPRRGRRQGTAATNPITASGPISWYDARDLTSTAQQTLPNRVGAGVATFGSTAGEDSNDPVRLPWSGTSYVYLLGTSGNHLSVARGAGWAATTHITATRLDNTTATFVSAADPIVIGGTSLTAGSYRRFDLRDTDGAGTLRATIDLATETLGQSSWTATTGQTVTVNRAGGVGLKTAVVTRPILLHDGTDDFWRLPLEQQPLYLTPTSGALTVLMVHRAWPGDTVTKQLFSTGLIAARGVGFFHTSGSSLTATVRGGGSSTNPSLGVASPHNTGTLIAQGLVANSGNVSPYSSLTQGFGATGDYSGFSTIDHSTTSGPSVGSATAGSPSTTRDGEYHAVVMWDRALTAQELNDVSAYLLGDYA